MDDVMTSNQKTRQSAPGTCRQVIQGDLMRNVHSKKSKPLFVTHNPAPELVKPFFDNPDTCVTFKTNWLTVSVGWDAKWREAVLAVAGKESFSLCASKLASPSVKGPAREPWAFAVDGLLEDFHFGSSGFTSQHYCGFHVEHGWDHSGRPFLAIVMPSGELVLLFRDPNSASSQPWSPQRAVVLFDQMEVGVFDCAVDLEGQVVRDAELDQLLTDLAAGAEGPASRGKRGKRKSESVAA
jgi:hypothetical protein